MTEDNRLYRLPPRCPHAGRLIKKTVIAMLVLFIAANHLIACSAIPSGNTSQSTQTSSSAVTTESRPTTAETAIPATSPSSTEAKPFDLSTIGTAIEVADLGLSMIHPSYFSWSPHGKYIVFMGKVKDDQATETWNVYLFRLSDRSIMKIMDGEPNVDYGMHISHWNQDESLLAFSFFDYQSDKYPVYLFHENSGSVEEIPVHGYDATFSPDNNRIALTTMDRTIALYNLNDRSVNNLGGKVKGHSPIWFSDSKRIIFCKQISSKETDIGTAYIDQICILDTTKPDSMKLIGSESAFYGISWLVPDEMVSIDAGWDDVSYGEILDLKTEQVSSFDEYVYMILPFQQPDNSYDLLLYPYPAGTALMDLALHPIGTYAFPDDMNQNAFDVLADHRLIFFNIIDHQTLMMASYINENRFEEVAYLDGACDVYLSPQRDCYAFLCNRRTKLLLINRSDILPER
jgi:WD40 repeat protein